MARCKICRKDLGWGCDFCSEHTLGKVAVYGKKVIVADGFYKGQVVTIRLETTHFEDDPDFIVKLANGDMISMDYNTLILPYHPKKARLARCKQ